MKTVVELLALGALVVLAADVPGLGGFAIALLALIFVAALLNSKGSISLLGRL